MIDRQAGLSARSLWAACALTWVGIFLLANRAILSGGIAPVWDGSNSFGPWQILVADYARAGRLLLWDPWSNGGTPDFAEPQSGAFSPLAIGMGALTGGSLSGFFSWWLAQWLTAGLGMLLLARHLGVPAWGGLIVATGFGFSGYFTGHAQHISLIHALAALPFVIWRLDAALGDRRWLPAVQAGALYGLTALAAYPGMMILTAGYALAWALGRVWIGFPDRTRPPAWLALRTLALVGGVAALVFSPSWVSFLVEVPGFSERAAVRPRALAVGHNALHPGALATFASPALGTLQRFAPDLWSYTDISSCSVYAGAALTGLALFALVERPRDRWRWWLLTLMALALAAAMGRALPLRGWLYDTLPPLRQFAHASIIRGFGIFSLSVLALEGSRSLGTWLRNSESRSLKLMGAWSLLAIAAIGSYALVMRSTVTADVSQNLATVHLLAIWGGLALLGFALPRLARAGYRRLGIVLLVGLAAADAQWVVTLARYTIYTREEHRVASWEAFDSRHSPRLDLSATGFLREAGNAPTNKNLATKQPWFGGYNASFTNRFHRAWTRHAELRAMVVGRQRLWFSADAILVAPTDNGFAALAERARTRSEFPLLLHEPDALVAALASESQSPSDVAAILAAAPMQRLDFELLSWDPDRLQLQIDSPEAGWLLVTERWAASWRARVNQRETRVWPANFIFRAVALERGPNTIDLYYEPFGYPELVVLSWTTLMLVGLFSAFDAIRRRG